MRGQRLGMMTVSTLPGRLGHLDGDAGARTSCRDSIKSAAATVASSRMSSARIAGVPRTYLDGISPSHRAGRDLQRVERTQHAGSFSMAGNTLAYSPAVTALL